MGLSRRRVLAATGTSLILAGCLGDDETDDTTPPADDDDNGGDNDMADENGESDDVTVSVRSHPEFGVILVGPDEMTLYNFDADTQGEAESACDDDCADAWPALTVDDTPVAGTDVTAELTTFEREGGTMQVTANGWPLYYFTGDEAPGDTEGQGVNDVWWVLRADGTPIRDADDSDEEEEVDADATVTVGADGLHFDPETLEIDVGETVAFVWEGDGHNIAVTDQPAEASWEGVDVIQDAGFTHHHTFDVSGDYEYVCEPHEGAGMAGSIHVGESDETDDGGGYGY